MMLYYSYTETLGNSIDTFYSLDSVDSEVDKTDEPDLNQDPILSRRNSGKKHFKMNTFSMCF